MTQFNEEYKPSTVVIARGILHIIKEKNDELLSKWKNTKCPLKQQ